MIKSFKYAVAALLDLLIGMYCAITAVRILWYHVVLGQSGPDFMWSELLVYAACGLAFTLFTLSTRSSIGASLLGLYRLESWRATFRKHCGWILLLLTFVTSWEVSRVNLGDMFSQQRLDAAKRLFSLLLTPNFANTKLIGEVLQAIVETLYIAFLATALALPVAFVLAFLSARNLMKATPLTFGVYTVLRITTNFARSIEPLVWAVIFTVWVRVGPFPGMLALCIHTIASLAKQYSEQIEDIDTGPMEAIEATGARPLQVIWFAVVPQVFIPFLSFTIYRWDINVRMATIIGLVGGGGIGSMLIQYQMLADWQSVGTIVLVIALVVWIMDYVSAKVREALR